MQDRQQQAKSISKPHSFDHRCQKALATGKVKLIRPLQVIGFDDAPHGHCEIQFQDYEVPADEMPNVVMAGVGRGFELIQSRLGPGRIHHCMRAIGAGEFALLRIAHRANHRLILVNL